MRALQAKRIAQQIDDVLWFLEHPETVTLGRRAKREPISVPPDYQTVDADRGGGLTWHGPANSLHISSSTGIDRTKNRSPR